MKTNEEMVKTNGEEEFDFLRTLEQLLKDAGIIEIVQSEVRNRAALWSQNDEKNCWLTSCNLQICFNERDREHIHTTEPFLMLTIGNIQDIYINMSVHGDTEYLTQYREGKLVYDDKRKR